MGNDAGVDKLLASVVVAGERAHHADREEKLHRLGLVVALVHVDDAAEVHTIEVDVTRGKSQAMGESNGKRDRRESAPLARSVRLREAHPTGC